MSGDAAERAKAWLNPAPCPDCGGDHSSVMQTEIREALADLVPELVAEIERLRAEIQRARDEGDWA